VEAVAIFGCAFSQSRQTEFRGFSRGEIEKFIIRQPPIGEKDDYDSENFSTAKPELYPQICKKN